MAESTGISCMQTSIERWAWKTPRDSISLLQAPYAADKAEKIIALRHYRISA